MIHADTRYRTRRSYPGAVKHLWSSVFISVKGKRKQATTQKKLEQPIDRPMEKPTETSATEAGSSVKLPENRFALELEFVQSLASPAYLHYLASMSNDEGQSLLLDPRFNEFLLYLQRTWSNPEYSRFITYPHSLYFLDLLINNDAVCRELAQVSFRNFCHQQQYYAWQNRFVTLYGGSEKKSNVEDIETNKDGSPTTTAGQPDVAMTPN